MKEPQRTFALGYRMNQPFQESLATSPEMSIIRDALEAFTTLGWPQLARCITQWSDSILSHPEEAKVEAIRGGFRLESASRAERVQIRRNAGDWECSHGLTFSMKENMVEKVRVLKIIDDGKVLSFSSDLRNMGDDRENAFRKVRLQAFLLPGGNDSFNRGPAYVGELTSCRKGDEWKSFFFRKQGQSPLLERISPSEVSQLNTEARKFRQREK